MAIAALCFLAGCGKDTGVFAELRGPALVSGFTLSVAGPHGVIAAQTFDAHVPGSVFVRLAAERQDVRLVAHATNTTLTAHGSVHVEPGQQPSVVLTLAADAPDADADGWPDAVDDCPTVADPTQTCSAETDAGTATRRSCSEIANLDGCVDFEDGGADLSNFGDATVTYPTGTAARGTGSLRVTRPNGENTYAGQYVSISEDNASLFIRFFIKLDSGHPLHPGIIEPQQTRNNDGLVMSFDTDATTLKDISVTNRKTGRSSKVAANITLGGWNCYEMEIAPVSQTLNIWVDGVALPDAGSNGAFNYDRIILGATYDVGEGGPVNIDDVAWSNSRIDCQ